MKFPLKSYDPHGCRDLSWELARCFELSNYGSLELDLPSDWSIAEVEATVADYFEMLSAELRGEPYSKAEHRRQLLSRLQNRTEGAIERKHGNISAVLLELGFPYVQGYKPYRNYQQLLFDVIESRLGASPDLENIVAADIAAEVTAPKVDDILSVLVEAPAAAGETGLVAEPTADRYRSRGNYLRTNYLRLESENAALGAAGEEFALTFERARLAAMGRGDLVDRMEHVSRTRGDGDGFDILSFEESGKERLIEVKTTKYGGQTPFFVSRNEVAVSEREADRYHLYRVFAFRKRPKLYSVSGAFSAQFALSPTQYLARIPLDSAR